MYTIWKRLYLAAFLAVLLPALASASIGEDQSQPVSEHQAPNDSSMGATGDATTINLAGLSAVEVAWLQQHRVLRIGIDVNWPPFEFVNEDGELSGISRGFVDEVEKRLPIDLVPATDLTWSETLNALAANELDVVAMVTPSEKRAERMLFTRPYISFPAVIVTRHEADYIGGITDLYTRKVAVGEGYVPHDALINDHPEVIPVPVADVATALELVSNGSADAALVNLAAFTYEVQRSDYTNLKVAAPSDYSYDLAMGVRKDWPELAQILDKALFDIDEQTKAAINNRWVNVKYQVGLDVQQVAL